MSKEQPQKVKSNNEKLIIGVIVGAVLGFLIYWSLDVITVYSETIFNILIVVAILFAVILLLFVWFRNSIIKRFFGKDIEFNSILNDTRETIQLISENVTATLPIETEKKEKIKIFAPKLINYILWSNFRNWGLRIFTSFVLGLGGIVTTILILNQNKLFENQNKRIEQQTHLIEADRRSAQIFIMGEVLSDINKELNDSKNTKRILSNTLIGRIKSLSRAMKPYRYLQGDSLISKPLSPERGQLLISLLESVIDSTFFRERILRECDFSYADLSNADLSFEFLGGVDFNNADFSDATLIKTNFDKAIMTNSNFEGAELIEAKMKEAIISGSNFKFTNLSNANLTGADLLSTNFQDAILDSTNLLEVNLRGASLKHAYFVPANIEGVDLGLVQSLDSMNVQRKDWLTYTRDSLKIRGSNTIFNMYKVDSIKIEQLDIYDYILIKK